MTIVRRVMLGFAAVAAGAAIVAGAGTLGLSQMRAGMDEMAQHAAIVTEVGTASACAVGTRRFEKDFIINAGDPTAQGKYIGEWRGEVKCVREHLAKLARLPGLEPAELDQVRDAERSVEGYAVGVEAMFERAKADPRAGPRDLNQAVVPVKDEIRKVIASLGKASENPAKQVAAGAEIGAAAQRRTEVVLVLVLLAVVAASVVVTWIVARGVGRAVGGVIAEAGRLEAAVAKGSLEIRGDEGSVGGEFRPVVAAVSRIMDAYGKPIALANQALTRLSNGDVPPPITEKARGDFNEINEALNRCIATVNALVADAGMLAKAAVEGKLATRADASRHQGDFRRIVQGVNTAFDALVGHLDSIPAPAMLVDRELRVRYMNSAALGVAGKSAAEAVGQRCSELFRTTDCNTERCACARAIRGERQASSETVARPPTGEYEIAYSGVPFRDDGKVIGALEVITDQTAVKRAMRTMEKVAGYQGRSAATVVGALEALSRGDLTVEARIETGDQETAEAARSFAAIGTAITRSADAIRALTRDAGMLAEAAVEGKLATRADAAKHQGDFRKVVEGVNRTLDAVLAPINDSATVLEKLSRRDLRARVTGNYAGDHAKIKESVNATAEALHDALAQVAQAVDQVASAASQIASSSQAVASGASEQAASLQETTSSVDSVAGMTRQSAENAQQANTLAQTARGAATEGAASMEQMRGAMGRVKASAERTSQIIRDINDIAFQTNLLALNAAVEAARAGEAGRGFAVVAEEVRSLALRAKEAATKTEELIRQSVKEAGEGEVTAKHVAGKLGEIVGGITKVTDIVAEIAAASKEQSTGIDQVNKALGEMDKVTQQNAASAEESSSAASELSAQSEELAAMVASFQLSRTAAGAERLAAPARTRSPVPAGHVNGHAASGAHRHPFPMDDPTADF
jgi:methyl-accepting chemotaxis protein